MTATVIQLHKTVDHTQVSFEMTRNKRTCARKMTGYKINVTAVKKMKKAAWGMIDVCA